MKILLQHILAYAIMIAIAYGVGKYLDWRAARIPDEPEVAARFETVTEIYELPEDVKRKYLDGAK